MNKYTPEQIDVINKYKATQTFDGLTDDEIKIIIEWEKEWAVYSEEQQAIRDAIKAESEAAVKLAEENAKAAGKYLSDIAQAALDRMNTLYD